MTDNDETRPIAGQPVEPPASEPAGTGDVVDDLQPAPLGPTAVPVAAEAAPVDAPVGRTQGAPRSRFAGPRLSAWKVPAVALGFGLLGGVVGYAIAADDGSGDRIRPVMQQGDRFGGAPGDRTGDGFGDRGGPGGDHDGDQGDHRGDDGPSSDTGSDTGSDTDGDTGSDTDGDGAGTPS
ncbi:hypothetical protein BH11ACT8_BH11ACT8_28370 [soil metagenome]